jgi:hypothetical protein
VHMLMQTRENLPPIENAHRDLVTMLTYTQCTTMRCDTGELIINISQPVYSGDAGEGMHGAGIPTDDHIEWAQGNLPWFECSDKDLETAYYFRMYSYHNHINLTDDDGYIVTEFYPHVPWCVCSPSVNTCCMHAKAPCSTDATNDGMSHPVHTFLRQ